MAHNNIPILCKHQVGEDYLTTSQFAEQIGVHENTVRYWRKQGLIVPVAQTFGGHVFYSKQQVKDYFDGRLNSSCDEDVLSKVHNG